ncbi:MAG: restriction endonuclease subunit S [Nitrosarchaeum sp.]|nr:restriction endonuclease subunit S [Nitrosarchaeum sp.]
MRKFDVYQRTYVITIKKSSKLGHAYVLRSIELSLEHLQSVSFGTATKYLTMSILEPFSLIIPDDATIKNFNQITSSILDIIVKNNLKIEMMSKIRDSLLPKLISGEILVGNV